MIVTSREPLRLRGEHQIELSPLPLPPPRRLTNAPGKQDNYLHTNPYPNTASPGEPKECESGKESFLVGKQVIGNVPGNQGLRTDGQR